MFDFFKYPKFKAVEYLYDNSYIVKVKHSPRSNWEYLFNGDYAVCTFPSIRSADRFETIEEAEKCIERYMNYLHYLGKLKGSTKVRKVEILL